MEPKLFLSDIVHTNPDYAWRLRTHAVVGEPEFTPTQVSAMAGVDLDEARRYWQALGFEKRFGLVEINYETLERTVRPSAYVYKEICETNAVVE